MNERRVRWLESKAKCGLQGVCLYDVLVRGRRCGPYLGDQVIPMALALGGVAIAPATHMIGMMKGALHGALVDLGAGSDLVIEAENTPPSGPILAWCEWRGMWAGDLFRLLIFDQPLPTSPARLVGLQARIDAWIR